MKYLIAIYVLIGGQLHEVPLHDVTSAIFDSQAECIAAGNGIVAAASKPESVVSYKCNVME